MATPPLIDSFGRVHDNLRVSVTDRCNIRCFYCMPETDVHFVERREILDFEEIERFVRIAVSLGIRKLRVTGGEPLVRRDLGNSGSRPDYQRRPPHQAGRTALRGRFAAHQCPPRYSRPAALPANYTA